MKFFLIHRLIDDIILFYFSFANLEVLTELNRSAPAPDRKSKNFYLNLNSPLLDADPGLSGQRGMNSNDRLRSLFL
jgi:hypothetical protein